MTKTMLVKTESVDMTWGVEGLGWGGVRGGEERESWCKETDVNDFSQKNRKSHDFFVCFCFSVERKPRPTS